MAATDDRGGMAAFDYSYIVEDIDWESEEAKAVLNGKSPTAAYGAASEVLRRGIPGERICAMFCGGKRCKFCRTEYWKEEQMAIKGLYSSWVTDNVLAMARPSTLQIETHHIVDQFKEAGIKSIINLQTPWEHSHCGQTLEDSGFTYKTETFMDDGIFFYNFAWPDYGTGSTSTIMDMVRVFQFAVKQGKVAVHCHAGRGRTGVIIGSYLIFNNRMSADEAIYYIRSKRPKSIQTRGQIECLQEFEKHLRPLRVIFSTVEEDFDDFTLSQFLCRQRNILHGYEARRLKHLPKVIFVCCERLLELAHSTRSSALHDQKSDTLSFLKMAAPLAFQHDQSDSVSMDSNQAGTLDNSSDSFSDEMSFVCDFTAKPSVLVVAQALATTEYDSEVKESIEKYKVLLNGGQGIWEEFSHVSDPVVLSALLWQWIDHLSEPIIRAQDIKYLLQHVDEPEQAFKRLEKGGQHVTEYLIRFIAKLQPIPDSLEDIIMHRLISVLTQQNVYVDNDKSPLEVSQHSRTHRVMKGDMLLGVMKIFYASLDIADKSIRKLKKSESRSVLSHSSSYEGRSLGEEHPIREESFHKEEGEKSEQPMDS